MRFFSRPYFIILLIISAMAIFYYDSFLSPFYREDRLFLDVQIPRDLFRLISDVHYHPISIQMFYFFGRIYFRSNLLIWHSFLFFFYAASFYFIYEIVFKLINSRKIGLLVVFLYAFNISLFAHFYWIAVSYFTLGSFYFFGSIYLFLEHKGWLRFALPFFILFSLGSNEATVVLFPLFFLLSWYQRNYSKSLILISIMGVAFLLFRFFILKLPTAQHYLLHLDLRIPKTLVWFVWRGLNLPEGIRFSGDPWLYILFFASLPVLGVGILCLIKSHHFNWRFFVLASAWFIIGISPFTLLPQHMSSYYICFAFFGFALVLAKLISPQKLVTVVFLVLYLLLAYRGLIFLHRTHVYIRKDLGWPGKFSDVDYYPPMPLEKKPI